MQAALIASATPDPHCLAGRTCAPNLSEIMDRIEAMCREAKQRTAMPRGEKLDRLTHDRPIDMRQRLNEE